MAATAMLKLMLPTISEGGETGASSEDVAAEDRRAGEERFEAGSSQEAEAEERGAEEDVQFEAPEQQVQWVRAHSRLSKTMTLEAGIPVSEQVRVVTEHLAKTSCRRFNKVSGTHELFPLMGTSPAVLGKYGVGVQLYFEFLFSMGILFLVLFLISMPMTVYNASGTLVEDFPSTSDASMHYKLVSYLSLGNLGSCPSGSCGTRSALRARALQRGSSTTVVDVAWVFGFVDALALMLFISFAAVFHLWWIPRTIAAQDDKNVTAADYAVSVTGLPRVLPEGKHVDYAAHLEHHFMELLRVAGVDEETPVREISLVRNFDGALGEFMHQGTLLHDVHNWELNKKMALEAGRHDDAKWFQAKATKLRERVVAMEHSLEQHIAMHDGHRQVCHAFVMFNRESQKNIILRRYRHSSSSIRRLFQPRELRFFGHPLKVVQAKEPTELYWENLDYPTNRHRYRMCLTGVVALTLITVCGLILAPLRSVDTKIDTSIRAHDVWVLRRTEGDEGDQCLRICRWFVSDSVDCLSEDWGVTKVLGFRDAVNAGVTRNESCSSVYESSGCTWSSPAERAWLALQFEEEHSVRCLKVYQPTLWAARELELYACRSSDLGDDFVNTTDWWKSCTRMMNVKPLTADGQTQQAIQVQLDGSCVLPVTIEAATQALDEAPEGSEVWADPRASCFCKQHAKQEGTLFRLPPYDTREKQMCKPWSERENVKMLYWTLGVVLVLIVNQAGLVIFTQLGLWAKYRTATDFCQSQVLELFITQLTITGLMTLLVGADLNGAIGQDTGFQDLVQIGGGLYDDFYTRWFVTIGPSLFYTIIGQAVSAIVVPILRIKILYRLRVWWFSRYALTINTIHRAHTLPEWRLSQRLAQTMNIVFCVMIYSGGMPMLYLVGFAYCIGAYWGDKWSLLRGSRRPPEYTEDAVTLCLLMFPIAALMHITITVWLFGQQELLPSDWSNLRGLAQSVLGISLQEYEKIMDIYTSGGSDIQEQYYDQYIRARCLDTAREGSWLLILMCICFCVYSILYFAYVPVQSHVHNFMVTFAGTMSLSWVMDELEDNRATSETFADVKKNGTAEGTLFSYQLSANERYAPFIDAIRHGRKALGSTFQARLATASSTRETWVEDEEVDEAIDNTSRSKEKVDENEILKANIFGSSEECLGEYSAEALEVKVDNLEAEDKVQMMDSQEEQCAIDESERQACSEEPDPCVQDLGGLLRQLSEDNMALEEDCRELEQQMSSLAAKSRQPSATGQPTPLGCVSPPQPGLQEDAALSSQAGAGGGSPGGSGLARCPLPPIGQEAGGGGSPGVGGPGLGPPPRLRPEDAAVGEEGPLRPLRCCADKAYFVQQSGCLGCVASPRREAWQPAAWKNCPLGCELAEPSSQPS